MAVRARRERGSGAVRQLPSRRWQAKFRTPDGAYVAAPQTFDTKLDANAWLQAQAHAVERGVWKAPEPGCERQQAQTLGEYAEVWLRQRELKPRTRAEYRRLLDQHVLPGLGESLLERITPTSVRNWYATLNPETPTRRAHAYSLLRSIYTTAVTDDLVPTNPCRIKAAGSSKKVHETRPATLPELSVIVGAMPDRYRTMVLLAAWCGLRFGELAELRRQDIDTEAGLIRVQRGVTRADGQIVVGDPKSQAGKRTVAVPPHLMETLVEHLGKHVQAPRDSLIFPARNGRHMAPSSLYAVWYPAREAAGRPDLRFHDLRHTGATLAAATGATLKELQARLGHSTVEAAMRYQHAGADRDRAIAEALSGFAGGTVIPLRRSEAG